MAEEDASVAGAFAPAASREEGAAEAGFSDAGRGVGEAGWDSRGALGEGRFTWTIMQGMYFRFYPLKGLTLPSAHPGYTGSALFEGDEGMHPPDTVTRRPSLAPASAFALAGNSRRRAPR